MSFDVFWCILMYFDVFWCILMYFDVFWCLLMYFDVFWCILMYFVSCSFVELVQLVEKFNLFFLFLSFWVQMLSFMRFPHEDCHAKLEWHPFHIHQIHHFCPFFLVCAGVPEASIRPLGKAFNSTRETTQPANSCETCEQRGQDRSWIESVKILVKWS